METCIQLCVTIPVSKLIFLNRQACANWTTQSFGTCNNSTGEPWVLHEGFRNPAAEEDLDLLGVTADTLEILALAWWFSSIGA